MHTIRDFASLVFCLLLAACAVSPQVRPAPTVADTSTATRSGQEGFSETTLIAQPEKDLGRVATVLGELEFTMLRLPHDETLTWVTATPHGLSAVFSYLHGPAEARWSTDGETWKSFSPPVLAETVIAAGEDVLAGAGSPFVGFSFLTRYEGGANGFTRPARLDFNSEVGHIVYGPRGAVATSGSSVLYSADGIHFSYAGQFPQEGSAPADDESSAGSGLFEGGCAPPVTMERKTLIGKIFATGDGFVALIPAHAGDWKKIPFCEPQLWFSADGSAWELVSDPSPFGSRAYVLDVAERNGRFVAIGGSNGTGGTVWVSDDGQTWSEVDIGRRTEHEFIAAGEMGWMLISRFSPKRTMWFSTNGMTWDGPYDFPYEPRCGWLPLVFAVGPDTIFGGCVGGAPMLARRITN